MTEISIKGLVKSFEVGNNILDGVTFQIESGERVGLLGRNGAGKSTIFKILNGEMDWDEGDVAIAKGKRVGLISQIPVYPEGYTVEDVLNTAFARHRKLAEEMAELTAKMAGGASDAATLSRYGELAAKFEGIGGYETETDVNKVAAGLGISQDMREQLFDQLSGGEKTRVNLGRLILEDTDILLLDEPTNHLDLHAVEWLEEYVRHFKGSVVVISHDRYFLDRTVDRVIEIIDGKAEFYSGNYSFYAIEKERRYIERMRQYEKEQAKIQQLEKAADQLRTWAYSGMDKTFKRAKSMERRIERMRTIDKPTKAKTLTNHFGETEFLGDEILHINNLSKSFEDKLLFDGLELSIEGGERIALIGDNGTGKSTLLKILLGEEEPDNGWVKYGPAVRPAYLPQIVDFDHPDRNLVDTMLYSKRGVSTQNARDRLAAFDFRGEDVFKPVSVLSGGERSRLKLCILMDEEINFLVLDEPTNHLDIASREWIEEAVESYEGALLFVSHDRYFINRFATRIWELRDGVITDYPVSFQRYRDIKEREKIQTPQARAEKKAERREKPAPGRAQQNARRKLTIVEHDMAKLEEESEALVSQLEEYACDYEKYTELYAQKEALDARLAELMDQWETLAEEAGE